MHLSEKSKSHSGDCDGFAAVFFGVLTLLSFMDIYKVQTEHLTGLCQKAKEAGMYAYGAGGSGTETITLPDIYSYQPIGGLIPLPKIWFHNTVKVHTWNGVVYENGKDTVESQPMVYVTESGSVYHRKLGCSYLNLFVQQISGSSVKALKNAYGEKYQACELCSRGQERPEWYISQKRVTVFITGKAAAH